MTTSTPIACALLPEWPIAVLHRDYEWTPRIDEATPREDRARTKADVAPRAVHRGRGHASRLLYCDATCRRHGLLPGQTLASARARTTALCSVPFDGERLRRASRALLGELLALTPRIEAASSPARAPTPPTIPMRLWLDVGRRWSEVDARAEPLAARLRAHAPFALGVGPTATAAYAAALSARARGVYVLPPERARAFLDACPLRVLEFSEGDLHTLAALGLRRVGELRAFEPAALARRLGPGARAALDRAWGDDARGPRTPREDDELSLRVSLDDPVTYAQALLFLLTPALERLCARLRARALGATCLSITLEGDDVRAPVSTSELRLASPSSEASVLRELLRTRLDDLHLDAPIHAFHLACPATAPLRPMARSLFETSPVRDPGAREVALGRLRERHGRDAVRRATREEDPRVLERARWLFEGQPARGEALPWRRLSPPAPMRHGRVELADGSRLVLRVGRCERVAPPFWRDGHRRAELFAWAELEGGLLVLLHGEVDDGCDDHWEAVAWVD